MLDYLSQEGKEETGFVDTDKKSDWIAYNIIHWLPEIVLLK